MENDGGVTRRLPGRIGAARAVLWLLLSGTVPGTLLGQERNARPPSEPVRFMTADGITIYGDLYPSSTGPDGPVIVLFHQAGSNARGEYGEIVPRLLANGYAVLAVDLRTGGSLYGGENRTVDAGHLPDSNDYCSAYPDVVATWRYVVDRGFAGPRFAWGSSFSAALVIRLAAEHPEGMSGVLAFSPPSGGPMEGCRPARYLDSLSVPALALRPEAEAAMASVAAQIDRFRAAGIDVYVSRPGTHGSSMLVPARAGGDTEAAWKAVLEFLRSRSSPH